MGVAPSAKNRKLSCNEAYAICCRKHLQCTPEDDLWFARLLIKRPLVLSGKSSLYWAHMRKAGGTSFGTAIESNVFNHSDDPSALFTQGFSRTVKQHLRAGSEHCVNHAYANETLFVTIIRHPVDRYVSEYFYSGVFKKLKSNKTEEKVIEWHNVSVTANGVMMSKARLQFIENWMTRWYTHPYLCEDLDRPPPHDSHPNYSYWRSGFAHDPRNLVTEADLESAKAVLDKFDIVGVAPFFGGDCSIVPWLTIAGSNNPVNETNTVKNKGKGSSDVQHLKGNVTGHLHDQIKFDLELFDFALNLSKRRSAIACCVNRHTALEDAC